MSFIQHNKQKKRVNSNGLLNKFKELENKINILENGGSKQNNNINNYENRIKFLEDRIKFLEKDLSNGDTKLLKNIINNDLNKLKIKIEKNENIIKKILFN